MARAFYAAAAVLLLLGATLLVATFATRGSTSGALSFTTLFGKQQSQASSSKEETLLTASVPERREFALHLGGFCFGKGHVRGAAGMVKVKFEGKSPARIESAHGTELWVAMYDDEPDHWVRVRENWETSSCSEKLNLASASQRLGYIGHSEFVFDISESINRHWHIVLVACPHVTQLKVAPHLFTSHLLANRVQQPPLKEEEAVESDEESFVVAWAERALGVFDGAEEDPDVCPLDVWSYAKDKVWKSIVA